MKYLIFGALMISNAYGAVWPTYGDWTEQDKINFQDWMASRNVKSDMFTNPRSKYYGIKVDCADVTYALRAVYAFENNLPYQVRNPIYKKERGDRYKYWSNEISRFDRYEAGIPRLIKFVNFLGDSLGTETLTYYDSYPIEIKKVTGGDIYALKKKTDAGGFLRHAYNIKGITNTGNFQLIWSNQQRKKEGRPMKEAEWGKLREPPRKYKWGFKRMKYPTDYGRANSVLEDYSEEQYSLAKRYNDFQFFTHIKNQLKSVDEDPNRNLRRQLKNLCDLANERVGVIASGENYRKQIGGRCTNYNEYDEYSTPSRDKAFLDKFSELKDTYSLYDQEGQLRNVNDELSSRVAEVLGIDSYQTSTSNFCEVEYQSGATPISLAKIYQGLKDKSISSHPNDSIHRRWGVRKGEKTNCKTWY